LLGQALFFLAYRRQFVKSSFWRLSLVAVLLMAAISPWLYYVFHVVHFFANSEPVLTRPGLIDIFNAFSQFLFGFQNDHVNTLIISLWPLTVILAFWAIRKNNKLNPESAYLIIAT